MRRAKVKATICLGRRKPDSTRKSNENSGEKCEASSPTEKVELNSGHKLEDLKVEEESPTKLPLRCHIISSEIVPSAESTTQNITAVHQIGRSPNVNTDFVVPEIKQIRPTITANHGILSRSKIRAVPKQVRKTASNTLGNDQKEEDSNQSLNEENTCRSNIQEPTSNLVVKRSIPENATSQNKHITAPLSPNKICRSKIRAVPILGNRRYHSASDSDDANKSSSSRTRTESQSSSISGVQDTSDETPASRKIFFKPEFKKKFRRSEGSRKLADARREFAKKFTGSKPDHKRLTMMDLIYYNPTTNPMKYENKKSESSKRVDDNNEQSEDVDNPDDKQDAANETEQDVGDKSEEEDEIIAPRIKIGPTGELILDEKSLVIENEKTKKAQEAIKNSYIFDGDADRPYGVFKRFKKTKWSQSDTLKFYRALSTVGTDFALMTELFPKRTRRELKLKFKKEERVNRALIDQAIMKPCNFNFEELKSEFKMMEIEETEIEKQQANKKDMSRKKQDKKSQKFPKLTQDDSTNSKESESSNETSEKKRGRKPKLHELPKPPKTSKKLDIFSAISDSDFSDPESLDDSEESFVLNSIQTTRYGRKTKRREIFEPHIDVDQEIVIQKRIRTMDPEPEPKQKPGSLMVVSSETSDGQPLVSIFMVTDDRTESDEGLNQANPNNLLPIAMIRTGHQDEEEIVENNYTIPADPPNDQIEENRTIDETEKK